MANDAFERAGMYFDDLNRIRVLDDETSSQVDKLINSWEKVFLKSTNFYFLLQSCNFNTTNYALFFIKGTEIVILSDPRRDK